MDSSKNTWADQWDYNNPDPGLDYNKVATEVGGKPSLTSRYSQKFARSFDKTKTAASGGMRKMKEGASSGMDWIKVKCHKKNGQK
ncbi:hypothetical protein QQ045_020178 [Rhodiola kirilowii]